jgi:hypothetical protein
VNIFETGGTVRSALPKWFGDLSARSRDCASNPENAQNQKDALGAANSKAESAEATPAARLNIGQSADGAFIKPKAFGFGQQAGNTQDRTGILNEICQNIVYMKQTALEEDTSKESAKPPKPEEKIRRGHWEDGVRITVKGNQDRADVKIVSQHYFDVDGLRLAEPVNENWAATGGLLHLDDGEMDFTDAAGNVLSLDRSFLWEAELRANTPSYVTFRSAPIDEEHPGMIIQSTYGAYDEWFTIGDEWFTTGFGVSFHGGFERPANEYAKLYGETLEKYNSGEIDSDEFDRRVGIMDKYFDEVSRGEQGELRRIISQFSRAMRVSDPEFFSALTDSDVNALLSDVGRMYDNIRDYIKSGGDVAGLTREIIEAGCAVSGLDDVKFLHSDKFWCDYMAPAMKAYLADKGLFQTTVGARWVEEHAKIWYDLNTGADADAVSGHLKMLLLKLVNYGNDYRPGSFLQQLPYNKIGR